MSLVPSVELPYDKTKIDSFTNETSNEELLKEYDKIVDYFNIYSSTALKDFNRFNVNNGIKFIARYSNIFPIKNAVDLGIIDGSHYIYDASMINFESGFTYFASHCPIYSTYDDSSDIDLFLRMLIENDIKIVSVPIQFVPERTFKWFPDEITDIKSYTSSKIDTYPSRNFNYTLKCLSKKVIYDPDAITQSEKDESIKIYYIEITDEITKKDHNVKVYQYDNWPDYGVPRRLNLLCAYIFKIWDNLVHFNNDNKKILVHCSAGVGRTGTVISCIELLNKINTTYLDILTKKYKEDKETHLKEFNTFILSNIVFMRTFRPLMVQKPEQLKAILALKDFYINTDPEIIYTALDKILTKDINKNFLSTGVDTLTGGSKKRKMNKNRIYSYIPIYDGY